ncbi:GNAT family N-acetyltransferase [Arsenicicoccus sp. oral taxon 190]|uniref:GNAT family N-acetyltransferase n=1 Tax=Arsenicicoccus sp. oral taxon 190 TaxID=1658671 RepID=UPI00067DF05C|nr:GNAT family N-acetyltransferase [Arsenicicoccus sp. oral taxon 190]
MRTISTREQLCEITAPSDLFATYAVPAHLHQGWACGDAVAYLRQSHSGRSNVTAWGPRPDLQRLVEALLEGGELSPGLDHVTLPRDDADVLTGRVGTGQGGAWDWLATVVIPARTPAEDRLEELHDLADAAELQALADRENPLSEGYPGTGRSERWVGVRDGGRIVACGAVHRLSSGAAHLSGILVAGSHRGQGLGRAVTAALTRDLLRVEPVVTLGMYADNVVARSLYHSMGFTTDKRWWSCSLEDPHRRATSPAPQRESACS